MRDRGNALQGHPPTKQVRQHRLARSAVGAAVVLAAIVSAVWPVRGSGASLLPAQPDVVRQERVVDLAGRWATGQCPSRHDGRRSSGSRPGTRPCIAHASLCGASYSHQQREHGRRPTDWRHSVPCPTAGADANWPGRRAVAAYRSLVRGAVLGLPTNSWSPWSAASGPKSGVRDARRECFRDVRRRGRG